MTIPSRPRRNRATREYHRTGAYPVERALPFLVERVRDPRVPDDVLTPVERGARAWRAEVLLDLGGPEAVPAAKLALVEAALGTKIVLDSLDRYLFELAGLGGLVNRRNRRAYSIVADRQRVADSLTRQLAVLGIDRVERPPVDLGLYLAHRQAAPAPDPQQGDRDAHDTEVPRPDPTRPA
jgi:hypothetical protein